jgi:hypothetical protein
VRRQIEAELRRDRLAERPQRRGRPGICRIVVSHRKNPTVLPADGVPSRPRRRLGPDGDGSGGLGGLEASGKP